MGQLVVSNAICQCSMGAAPCNFQVLPAKMVNGCSNPAANIADNIPYVNISGFGMCSSAANPAVAAATAAAMGVLTPAACIPTFPAPWSPGVPTRMIKQQPALDNASILNCAYGGVVSITYPGQAIINVK